LPTICRAPAAKRRDLVKARLAREAVTSVGLVPSRWLISGPLRTPSLAGQAPMASGQNQNGDRAETPRRQLRGQGKLLRPSARIKTVIAPKHRIVSFAGKPRSN